MSVIDRWRLAGRTLGHYKVKTLVGHNSVSAVYRAEPEVPGPEMERDLAIRVLPVDSIHEGERFLDEIRVAARLRHECLVPMLDFGVEGDMVYIVMPEIKGGSLQDRLRRRSAIETAQRVITLEPADLPALREVAAMLDRLAAGLDHAHAEGIIHHQIQPRNILVDLEGRVYLADTGLAKLFKVIFSLNDTNTFATYDYSPPEQWEGLPLVPASDQYALAAIVYLLVTGRPLFQASTIYGLMNMHLNEFLIPPHHIRAGLPGSLTSVLIRALAKKPGERYPTIQAFADDFRRAVSGLDDAPTDFFTFTLRPEAIWAHEVFVAHSESGIEEAQQLYRDLNARGVSIWSESLARPGSVTWQTALRDGVRDAACVVIVLAPGVMKSEWINIMLSHARRYKKPVLGLVMRGKGEISQQAFSTFDARTDYNAAVDALAASIKQLAARV